MTIYEKALETYNTGRFLQLEGSFGREFVRCFLDTDIIKTIDEPGNKVIDGYGRPITLRKAVIDQDKIDSLWLEQPEFMEYVEDGFKAWGVYFI
jgi:nicotinamide riboside kinase